MTPCIYWLRCAILLCLIIQFVVVIEVARPGEKTSTLTKGIIVQEDLLVPTFLCGPEQRFYGRGPAPEKLDLLWKLEIDGGWTRRNEDNEPLFMKGMGWTGAGISMPVIVDDRIVACG